MDAPKCQKIPSCGKAHFGDCGTTQAPREKKAARKPEKKSKLHPAAVGALSALAGKPEPEKKSKPADQSLLRDTLVHHDNRPLTYDEMLARIALLEDRMDAMDRRRVSQRKLMRKRRAEGK